MKQQKETSGNQSYLQLHQKPKIPRNTPNQRDKRSYSENYRTLMKETEEDTRNGKTCQVHGLEEQLLLKVYTSQSNLHIQCNPYKNATSIFTELEETILKFVWNRKRP